MFAHHGSKRQVLVLPASAGSPSGFVTEGVAAQERPLVAELTGIALIWRSWRGLR